MNRGVNSGEFIDPFNIRPMSDTAKNPNETTSEEMAAALSRFQSAIASILKSGDSGKRFESFFVATGDDRCGMGILNEYLNLGGVEVAEPEQEAREATAVYARCFLERAEPPACVKGADDEERRWRFVSKDRAGAGPSSAAGSVNGTGGLNLCGVEVADEE
jgi:hypothetical protein